jgi:small-conductance mechanosensitive channel
MLRLTGRKADGWLPSFGVLDRDELRAGNEQIDAAAERAGRDPGSIRRILNLQGLIGDGRPPSHAELPVGYLAGKPLAGPADWWVETLAGFIDDGFDTIILWPVVVTAEQVESARPRGRPAAGRLTFSGPAVSVGLEAEPMARRARAHLALLLPLITAVVVAYSHRAELFGADLPVRIGCVIALVILGWSFAMNLGRAVGPTLLKRLDPDTAGTVGFLIRLLTLMLSVIFALRLAGLRPETLAVGGAITAVILGLAAQQTIGNLISGTVLLSARPFRVGDRVRMHAGGVAGQVEGTVASLGLLYTTLANGEDRILVPNNVVLSGAVVPLREPSGVDLRARLDAEVKPSQVEQCIEQGVTVATRNDPQIDLEEFVNGEIIVRVRATPVRSEDGSALADEVLAALDEVHTAQQVG